MFTLILNKTMRGVNMGEKENTENRRLNLILIAILIVNILDFITRLVRG